ncbi:MAG: hypothetical protein AB7E85_03965 [Pseudobdellovibrionaceae bacterium]
MVHYNRFGFPMVLPEERHAASEIPVHAKMQALAGMALYTRH